LAYFIVVNYSERKTEREMIAYYKLLLVSASAQKTQSFEEVQVLLQGVENPDLLDELIIWYNGLVRSHN